MKNKITHLFTLLLSASIAYGQEIPSGGAKMLGPFPMKTFSINDEDKASLDIESSIFTIETREVVDNTWDLQVSARNKYPCSTNDIMLIVFDGKMIYSKDETGKALINVVFERASSPYEKSVFQNIQLSEEWKTYYIPFEAKNSFNPGEAQINFQVGFKPQKLQLKNIRFYNYQDRKKMTELPITRYTYDGREADAAWRKKANEQIDKYRKANISIAITDKKGNPKEDIEVEIEQTDHAFGFGTAVDAATFNLRKEYRETLAQNFNKVVFENDLKWPQWENPHNKNEMYKVLNWCNDNKIPVRGHVLVWPGWQWLPYHVKDVKDDPEKLKLKVNNHIEEEAGELKGKIAEWDVLNEPFTNTDLTDICGQEVMIDWFKKTEEADPKAVRYINDFSIIGGGATDKTHQDHYYNTIKYLVDNGAPIQGIGFQSHFGSHLTPPTKLWSVLDRYADFGLEMQVTEFDVDIQDDTLQADYTRDFLTAIFAYPKMKGVMIWGFWENRHWRPNAAMYKSDWTPKPNAIVWKELIYNTWWTKTTANNNTSIRGFMGNYRYRIKNKKGDTIHEGTFTLDSKGYQITYKMK